MSSTSRVGDVEGAQRHVYRNVTFASALASYVSDSAIPLVQIVIPSTSN